MIMCTCRFIFSSFTPLFRNNFSDTYSLIIILQYELIKIREYTFNICVFETHIAFYGN